MSEEEKTQESPKEETKTAEAPAAAAEAPKEEESTATFEPVVRLSRLFFLRRFYVDLGMIHEIQ